MMYWLMFGDFCQRNRKIWGAERYPQGLDWFSVVTHPPMIYLVLHFIWELQCYLQCFLHIYIFIYIIYKA